MSAGSVPAGSDLWPRVELNVEKMSTCGSTKTFILLSIVDIRRGVSLTLRTMEAFVVGADCKGLHEARHIGGTRKEDEKMTNVP